MRLLVRTAVVLLLGVLAVIFLGPLAPEGSWVNQMADGFARALRIRWVGPVVGS